MRMVCHRKLYACPLPVSPGTWCATESCMPALYLCRQAHGVPQKAVCLPSTCVARHMVYHKNRLLGERTESLERMQTQSAGILVCTDAAARGIDIQDVSHVIQVSFSCRMYHTSSRMYHTSSR